MTNQRANGIVIGIVSDLEDPEGLGRIRYTSVETGVQSNWTRISTPMAGPGWGIRCLPDLGTEILVAYEHGDGRFPYVLGALWNQSDPPPEDDGNTSNNNWRTFKSRSGHVISFDDTAGAEKIEVVDKDGQRKMILDSANRKIQVVSEVGDVEVSAQAGNCKIEALTVEVKASANMSLEAGGIMTIKGAVVNIN